jgi:hypothetical protein
MAPDARGIGVRTRELEGGLGVVKYGARPAGGGMALSAVLAELAPMLVVPAMAGDAILWCARVNATSMALHARGSDMRSRELEGRLRVVKYGARPAGRGVTLGAVLAELAPVLVIPAVAGHASMWRAGVNAPSMALDARGVGMRTRELEGGLGVVKYGARPASRRMTLGTVLAKLAAMFVIPAMAGDAILWCAGIVVGRMALYTGSSEVGPSEREGSQGVVDSSPGPT